MALVRINDEKFVLLADFKLQKVNLVLGIFRNPMKKNQDKNVHLTP
jgi:hypothetical protein